MGLDAQTPARVVEIVNTIVSCFADTKVIPHGPALMDTACADVVPDNDAAAIPVDESFTKSRRFRESVIAGAPGDLPGWVRNEGALCLQMVEHSPFTESGTRLYTSRGRK